MSRYKRYKATYQAYYQAHKEMIRQLMKTWREGHKEHSKEYDRQHRFERSKWVREWRERNPEKYKIHTLIMHHLEDYPLDTQCVFCGETSNLEHAHLDYEDDGHNYVTACHGCNLWMRRGVD